MKFLCGIIIVWTFEHFLSMKKTTEKHKSHVSLILIVVLIGIGMILTRKRSFLIIFISFKTFYTQKWKWLNCVHLSPIAFFEILIIYRYQNAVIQRHYISPNAIMFRLWSIIRQLFAPTCLSIKHKKLI